MKPHTADIELYAKELRCEAPAGTLYSDLYRESRANGSNHWAAKSVASRRRNLANWAYRAAATGEGIIGPQYDLDGRN